MSAPCSFAMEARSFSTSSGSPNPFIITLQPLAANARTNASPMPPVEPVTSAVFPFSISGPGKVSASIRLDAGVADHLPPFLDVTRKNFAERIGRAFVGTGRLGAELGELLAGCRSIDAFGDRGVDLLDDLRRRALGREQCVPEHH